MGKLHSTTSLPAIRAYWNKKGDSSTKIVTARKSSKQSLYVRRLTENEVLENTLSFPEGHPTAPWFGCFRGGDLIGVTDDLEKMSSVLKKMKYRIIDIMQQLG